MNRITTLLLLAFLVVLGVFYWFANKPKPVDPGATATAGKVTIVSGYSPATVTEFFFEDLKKGTRVNFRKTPAGWELTTPLVYPADNAVVESMLAPFQYNECTVVADLAKSTPNLADFGLLRPRVVVRISLQGQEKSNEVLIGDEDVTGDQVFLLSNNRVLRTSKNVHNGTQRTIDEMRNKDIFTLDASDLKVIQVDGGTMFLRLELQNGVWMIDSPWKEKADPAMVNALVNGLFSIRVKRFYEDHPGPDKLYAMDSPVYRIFVKTSTQEQELRIATDSGGILMAKRVDLPYLWELSPEAVAPLSRENEEFRDHSIFRNYRDDLTEVRFGTQSGEVVFTRKMNVWGLAAPKEFPLDKAALEDLLSAIEKLSVVGFIDRGNEPWKTYGLEATPHWIQVSTRANKTTKLWIGEIDGQGKRFARREKDEAVVLIPETAIPNLDGSVFDFVAKQIIEVPEQETRLIEIVSREEGQSKKVAWQRDEKNVWRKMTPTGDVMPEEDRRFSNELDFFLHWKGNRAVADNPHGFGFESPLFELRFYDSTTGTEQTLKNFLPIVKGKSGNFFAASKAGMVYEINSRTVEKLKTFLQ